MPRGRSRSPKRPSRRNRSRSRSRERRVRRRDRRSSRSPYPRSLRRSRSPFSSRRNRSRSRSVEFIAYSGSSENKSRKKSPSKNQPDAPQISNADIEGKSEEEVEMMKLMGFSTFDSTKGKQVGDADVSAVHVIQKRKYRQYMNRRGGFNRPLDFVA